jgi:hypothetical protein
MKKQSIFNELYGFPTMGWTYWPSQKVTVAASVIALKKVWHICRSAWRCGGDPSGGKISLECANAQRNGHSRGGSPICGYAGRE